MTKWPTYFFFMLSMFPLEVSYLPYLPASSFSLMMHFHLNAVQRSWSIVCNDVKLPDVSDLSPFGCLVFVAAGEVASHNDQGFFADVAKSLNVEDNLVGKIIYIVSRNTSNL